MNFIVEMLKSRTNIAAIVSTAAVIAAIFGVQVDAESQEIIVQTTLGVGAVIANVGVIYYRVNHKKDFIAKEVSANADQTDSNT